MTLLQDIQNSAIDANTNLDTLLRKCRVLASRLNNSEFKEWVLHELDGYGSNDVPDYRKFRSFAQGHFSGPFGTQVKNIEIPETHIPEEYRSLLLSIEMKHSVSEIIDMIDDAVEGRLINPWPAFLYPLFAGRVFDNMSLLSAWTVIPKNRLVGILNTVRNRVLSLALEIEEENPEAGELAHGRDSIPEEKVTSMVNTNIFGNVENLASGSIVEQMNVKIIKKGDFESLSTYLAAIGFDNELIESLKIALEIETAPLEKGFGEKVASWFGNAMKLAAQGGLKIASSTASAVLTNAIMTYYGIQ